MEEVVDGAQGPTGMPSVTARRIVLGASRAVRLSKITLISTDFSRANVRATRYEREIPKRVNGEIKKNVVLLETASDRADTDAGQKGRFAVRAGMDRRFMKHKCRCIHSLEIPGGSFSPSHFLYSITVVIKPPTLGARYASAPRRFITIKSPATTRRPDG